jgi:hypothetical protein
MANLHPGDQVSVIAECSRRGQLGIVEQLLPSSMEEDQYQVCVILFASETGGKQKEHYFVKELRVSQTNS